MSVPVVVDVLPLANTVGGQSHARIYDEVMTQFPEDLYIPPDALAVFLENFEGPLDLLLYLIRKQNLDILDNPVAEINGSLISRN